MKLSTAWKISGMCLFALAAEAILSYFLFSSYAFSLAETGQYTMAEAYSSGPMGNLANLFYIMFGMTVFIGVATPLFALLSLLVRKQSAPDTRN